MAEFERKKEDRAVGNKNCRDKRTMVNCGMVCAEVIAQK